MSSKVRISSITLSQLDSESLTWVSKIARSLRKSDDVIINLQEQSVLSSIVNESRRSQNPEVKRLYQQLKSSLRSHINSKNFNAQLSKPHPMDRFVTPSTAKSQTI
jgi:hypothetical protein